MSKRTRAAADFMQQAIKAGSSRTAITTSLTTTVKKSRTSLDGAITTAVNSNGNYEPDAIASLKALVNPLQSATPNLTDFQRRVYALTKRIPAGHVSTYKYVAESLGCPRAYRAVGNALRHNPFAPFVPCHRVLTSSGEIGGFAGSVGDTPLVTRKMSMLKTEGIEFESANPHTLRKDTDYRRRVVLEKIDASDLKTTDRQLNLI